MTQPLVCDQRDCPLATEHRCLEGFADPAACPHTRQDGSGAVGGAPAGLRNEAGAGAGAASDEAHGDDERRDDADGDDVSPDEYDDDSADAAVSRMVWVQLGGDEALTLAEAEEIAARAPCRVVLVAGEFETGKTTLVVELYARFLTEPFAAAEFGGSRTLRALDRRHHPARADSGGSTPTTDRTADTDMRLLHLRLRRHGRVQDLLLSDVWGEFFENIIDGAGATDQVPLAGRADVCILAVDGEALAAPGERQRTVTRARALLGGLTESGALQGTSPIVITATKVDLLAEGDGQAWAADRLESLRQFAEDRGHLAAVEFVAARPPAGAPPEGLDRILDHILPPPEEVATPTAKRRSGDRQFWNQPDAQP